MSEYVRVPPPNMVGGRPTRDAADAFPMARDEVDRTLDARTIDGPPFEPIVAAVEALAPGETLRLVNGFEPVPLYEELERRGATVETERVAEDEWHVYVTLARTSSAEGASAGDR